MLAASLSLCETQTKYTKSDPVGNSNGSIVTIASWSPCLRRRKRHCEESAVLFLHTSKQIPLSLVLSGELVSWASHLQVRLPMLTRSWHFVQATAKSKHARAWHYIDCLLPRRVVLFPRRQFQRHIAMPWGIVPWSGAEHNCNALSRVTWEERKPCMWLADNAQLFVNLMPLS